MDEILAELNELYYIAFGIEFALGYDRDGTETYNDIKSGTKMALTRKVESIRESVKRLRDNHTPPK